MLFNRNMKNYVQLFIVLANIFPFCCTAQHIEGVPANEKMSSTQIVSNASSRTALIVVAYRVEERINKPMGSSITTYTVSSLALVGKNDLGENNSRFVTPKYGRPRVSAIAARARSLKVNTNVLTNDVPIDINSPIVFMKSDDSANSNEATPSIIESKVKNVKIDVLATYERIMDKGYKNVDMITKVGNGHFFAGDLALAAKWYTELFSVVTDLEPVYYYRYAQALKAVNQFEKASAMMKIFETKSL